VEHVGAQGGLTGAAGITPPDVQVRRRRAVSGKEVGHGWDRRLGCRGGAGGAVTAEALGRGWAVTAVVRDPERYRDLPAEGVTVVRGDVTDAGSVAGGVGGQVHAVSPFSGPEQGVGSLDPDFIVKAADALLGGLGAAGVPRLVAVGLFANLLGADGRTGGR